MQTSYATCSLCEAMCGIEVEHDGTRIHAVRGDKNDAFSGGYLCPKATALADVHHDPDRVREPLRRRADGSFEPVSWDEAFEDIGRRLGAIRREHGRDAVGLYLGNPTVHDHGAALYAVLFWQLLKSRNVFTANSVDGMPRQLASYWLYGAVSAIPVPDVDRTDFFLIFGANPLVSQGSQMSAPNIKRRLKELQKRGGKIAVVDPRRSETAQMADHHLAVQPGSDVYLLAALVHVIIRDGLEKPGRLAAFVDGRDDVARATKVFSPERVADVVGVDASTIERLAHDFAAADSAVCYGRMGVCTQRYGVVCQVLIDALNILTGNLDRPGGFMFTTPAVDVGAVLTALSQNGSFDRFRSRVSDMPEVNNELPVAAMAEEMDTPGKHRIRAMILHAGNPVLSVPNGRRMERALADLDLCVAIDIYINESTRHADYILPAAFGLEHDHYGILLHSFAVRNTTKYSLKLIDAPPRVRPGWRILLQLSQALLKNGTFGERMLGPVLGRIGGLGPKPLLKALLRFGPHKISLDALEREPHGRDLGALQPRLPEMLASDNKRIGLMPNKVARELEIANEELSRLPEPNGALRLISRRHLRSNNSWMHNSQRLVKGPARCTLKIHPADAAERGVNDGDKVEVASPVATVEVVAQISDEMKRGVVSLPHGWGHDREGSKLSVAAERPGASINDLTDDRSVDRLSGTSSFLVDVQVQTAAG